MLSKERVTDNLLYRLEDAGGFAVTNAQFAALHGLPVALWPFDDARSTSQTARSSRVGICRNATTAAGFRLRLGGGTFRFGFVSLGASLRPSLHFPRSPTADRS